MRNMFHNPASRRIAALVGLLILGVAVGLDQLVDLPVSASGHTPNRVANILLVFTAGVIIAFLVLYGTRSPWRQHQVGRRLMYLAASQAAVLVQNAVSIYWGPDYPLRGFVRMVLYASIGVTWAGMVLSLLHYQSEPLDTQLNDLGEATRAQNADSEDASS